jgi:hypothetical protein
MGAGNESFSGIHPKLLATIPTNQNRFNVSEDVGLGSCPAIRRNFA